MANDFDVLKFTDGLLDDARRKGWNTVQIRVGRDLEQQFKDQAGVLFAENAYAGVPVSFDAIDPTTVLTETEPA